MVLMFDLHVYFFQAVMVDDGLTTIEELVKALLEAKEDCQERLLTEPPPTDDNGKWEIHYTASSATETGLSVSADHYL